MEKCQSISGLNKINFNYLVLTQKLTGIPFNKK